MSLHASSISMIFWISSSLGMRLLPFLPGDGNNRSHLLYYRNIRKIKSEKFWNIYKGRKVGAQQHHPIRSHNPGMIGHL